MVNRMLVLAIVVNAVLAVNAEVLFYTDFRTTPAGFAAASAVATALGGDDTLVANPAPSTVPKDTIIDGCTLSANKSSSTNTVIVISKASQSYVQTGDTAGCTPGRLGLKQTGNSITFPSVNGPCTITYYAAGSSAAGKGMVCLINGVDTPEAGFPDLAINSLQATRKMVYPCTLEGPVVFTLSGNGGAYLYDVKIESGAIPASTFDRAVHREMTSRIVWTKDNLIINNSNARIDIFTIAGKKVMRSNRSLINLSELPKGIYMARAAGTGEKVKFVR